MTVKGLPELKEQFAKLAELAEGNKEAIRAGVDVIRDAAKDIVPVKTGFLRDSITSTDEGIEVTAPYAFAVEYGTSRKMAQPYIRPAIDTHKREIVDAVEAVLQQEVNKIV